MHHDFSDPTATAELAARTIRERLGIDRADIGLVLGSGWSAGADHLGEIIGSLALAEIPEQIRGYGHVKEAALTKAREQATQLKARLTVSEIAAVQLFEPAA